MPSLAEAFPAEQARARHLLSVYRDLPDGVGAFGAMMIEATLADADRAIASGDVIAMIRAYEALKDLE